MDFIKKIFKGGVIKNIDNLLLTLSVFIILWIIIMRTEAIAVLVVAIVIAIVLIVIRRLISKI